MRSIPTARRRRCAFDLDGDGTYETDGPSARTTFDPGVHEIGVRASDGDAVATSRRTVFVGDFTRSRSPSPIAPIRPGVAARF